MYWSYSMRMNTLTRTICSRFEATEAKMLRVAVSTFCDYLNVSLKCFQEFEQR